MLVESGSAWRKLNVQRVLDESTQNHVKMRSEEAERKNKSRKCVIVIDDIFYLLAYLLYDNAMAPFVTSSCQQAIASVVQSLSLYLFCFYQLDKSMLL